MNERSVSSKTVIPKKKDWQDVEGAGWFNKAHLAILYYLLFAETSVVLPPYTAHCTNPLQNRISVFLSFLNASNQAS